ncbi:glycosyltransferase [Spongiimicrobium salis]|uniref:glycosyltransferase n=1 Tax=Spongiimicrobium salis TaxID=1667022 RepID=UPI00374CB6DA
MDYFKLLINAIEWLLVLYLGSAAVYIFIFSLAGLFGKRGNKSNEDIPHKKFAVLIPGYKEDAVIVDVARKALDQDYPKAFFEIVVIADSFKPSTLEQLKKLPIRLIEVDFEVSTKSKALNKAMETIGDAYDVALVLDADNIMETAFIRKMNEAFHSGYQVVQGHRVAKNTNTSFAILDAISEEVNNHIFRKGHRALGLSSALIGSGMGFNYAFFKKTMAQVNAVGGFDKELELKLLRRGEKIEYLHHALVYDEKVQKAAVFANQRKRWLSAQFIYFRRFIGSGIKELLLRGNIDFFDKVYQMISPPRVLLAGGVSLLTAVYVLVNFFFLRTTFLSMPLFVWITIFSVVCTAFIMAIPVKFYTRQTLKAILTLPRAFVLMFVSLFKLKGANKKFIHTEHGTIH